MKKVTIKGFESISEKIKLVKDNKGGDYVLLEPDNYDALVIGASYEMDKERTFANETKVQDIITYYFAIPNEGKFQILRKEYTVSNYIEKAQLPQMLAKFGIDDIEEFSGLIGMTIRVSVDNKVSKGEGKKTYHFIDKLMPAKKGSEEIEIDTIEIPYFYLEGIDLDNCGFIDGVTMGKPKDDGKTKRTKIVPKTENYDVEEEEIVEDDSDLDDFMDDM